MKRFTLLRTLDDDFVPRPIGILAGSEVIGEWSGTSWDDVPGNAALFALDLWHIAVLHRRCGGHILYWMRGHDEEQRARMCGIYAKRNGRKYYVRFPGLPLPGSPVDKLALLRELAEWTRARRVNLTSLAATSAGIFRSTLTKSILIGGDVIPTSAFVGGRQEAVPGVHDDVTLWDKAQAYADVLSRMPIVKRYRHVPEGHGNPTWYHPAAFYEAVVDIPNIPYGPLPVVVDNLTLYPTGETIVGTWSGIELATAADYGARIRTVGERWVPTVDVHRNLYMEWLELTQEAKQELSPELTPWIKAMQRMLWSSYGVSGHMAIMDGLAMKHYPPVTPRHLALSALTAAWQRSDMFTEAYCWGEQLIASHTDSALLPQGLAPRKLGNGPGEWRSKGSGSRAVVLTAQNYALETEEGWRYVMSGVKPGKEKETFRLMANRALGDDYLE